MAVAGPSVPTQTILPARKESPDKNCARNRPVLARSEWGLDHLLKLSEFFVVNERDRNILNYQRFRSSARWGTSRTAIHRVRVGNAPIFKPNIKSRLTIGIENREILEIVRYERRNFDQMVIESGGIILQLADTDPLGVFTKRRHRKATSGKRYCQQSADQAP